MTKLQWILLTGLLLSGPLIRSALGGPLRFEPIEEQASGVTPALESWKRQVLTKNARQDWTPTGVRICDQDGDGQLDLIVTSRHNGWMILRQVERLSFRDVTASLLPTGNALADGQAYGETTPVIFDLNRDGFCDFVPTGRTAGRVLLNYGDRLSFGEPISGLDSRAAQILDLNSDGYLDLLQVTRRFGNSTASEYLNVLPQFAGFRLNTQEVPLPAGLPADLQRKLMSFQVPTTSSEADGDKTKGDQSPNVDSGPFFWEGDLDGDGVDDCIVQYAGRQADREHRFGAYCLGNSSGSLEDKTASLGIPASLVPLLSPIDVTGDGKLDLFTAYGAAAGLYVQKSDGGFRNVGGPLQMLLRPMTHTDIPALQLHDFDRDGDDDLIVSAGQQNELEIFENQGGGLFRPILKVPHWPGDGFDVADLDGNGLLDLVVGGGSARTGRKSSNSGDAQLTLWMNRSTLGPRQTASAPPERKSSTLKLNSLPPKATERVIETWNVRIPGIYEGTIEILEELTPLDDAN